MKIAETDADATWSPTCVAAVLILAHQLLQSRGMAKLPATATAIADALGCSRSQAYTLRDRLELACVNLVSPPGRTTGDAPAGSVEATLVALRDFLYVHPGAATGHGDRRRYTEVFRRFVVGLFAEGAPAAALTVEQAASVIGVPLGTLKNWLRVPKLSTTTVQPAIESEAASSVPDLVERYTSHPDIAVILHTYQSWEGDFVAFCDHLWTDHRLTYGRTFVATILTAAGLRPSSTRRSQRPPWTRDTFRRLFPGAQWLGDGTELGITVNGQAFAFNLEAISDVDSSALLGVAVSDTEDEAVLLQTFDHAVLTAGENPLAITLDNRPSNHTEHAVNAMSPTEVLRATPGRGQAKAGIEGAFGLFAQTAPPLVITGSTPRERARSILSLLATLWAWARNGKPQHRSKRSPRERYLGAMPSPEQMQAAHEWIAELRRRRLLAAETLARRADPVRRQLLCEGLLRLGIADPDHCLASALSRFSNEAIMRGLAIFGAKQQLGSLPPSADPGRYLGGVIRNTDTALELQATTEHLLDLRLRHRQLSLIPLEREHQAIVASTSADGLPRALLDQALHATAEIAFVYWVRAACGALAAYCRHARASAPDLTRLLARTVAAAFKVTKQRRQHLVAELTRAAVELA